MHTSKIIQAVEKKFLRTDLPEFRAGDTLGVHAKIKEGGKERIQYVEGVVIKRSGQGSTKTFTLRKISDGIGVEIIYPLASDNVTKIDVVSQGDVRRARLYYLRELTGKAARLKTKDTMNAADAAKVKSKVAAKAAAAKEKAN